MTDEGWSQWYQPADVTLRSSTFVGTTSASQSSKVWCGETVFPDFSGVDFGSYLPDLSAGYGTLVNGDGRVDDYCLKAPTWASGGANYPIVGVGYRGQAIGPTFLFPAPTWNMQTEASLQCFSTVELYSVAGKMALDDPLLPYTNTTLWPPGATAIVDVDFEHYLFPYEDGSDYYGGSTFKPWSGSSSFVDGVFRLSVDPYDTTEPWTFGAYLSGARGQSDVAFMHRHGGRSFTLECDAGSPPVTVDLDLLRGWFDDWPTLPLAASIGTDYRTVNQNLDAHGFATISAAYVHEGVAAGSWNYDIGDGTADAYNSQRALAGGELIVRLRPSRVRFKYDVYVPTVLTGQVHPPRVRFN